MIRLLYKLIILGLAIYGGLYLWETHLADYFDFNGVRSQGHLAQDVGQSLAEGETP